jgi:ATP synthase protein I
MSRSHAGDRTPTPLGLTLRSGLRGVILAAPVALALSGALGGVRGLVSSAVGLLLVGSFFLISMVLVERANTVGPALTLPVALTVYGVKVVILGAIVFGTDAVSHMSAPAFCWTVVGATLAWLISHAVGIWRTRMPYVVITETDAADRAADPREQPAREPVGPSSDKM